MEIAGIVGILILVGIGVVVLIVIGLIALLFARSWIKVARADEALVISGRKQKVQRAIVSADGTASSEIVDSPVTVIVNGKSLVNPITQRHEIISLRSRQVSLNAEAQSLDSVTLNVDGVAIVKIGSDPLYVRRAAERFASQDKAIEQFTTEQLEGALRGIVATLSVVELMRERKKFSDQIAAEVSQELAEQGLILDSFQIKGITDKVGYIQSLGAPEIQAKRQSAEISQTNRAINQKYIANQEANLIEQTALDTNTANANAGIGRARAEAEQAEQLARAQAEQAVLQQQAENKQAQLDADVKRVADAQKYEAETRAQAELYTRERAAEAAAIEQVKQAEARTRIAEQQAKADKARADGESAAAVAKATGEADALRAQAEAESEARRLRANAEADAIRAEGEARAAAVEAEANAIASNQEAFLSQRVLEVLPQIMGEFAKGYASIGNVSIVGGSGEDGASNLVGADSAKAMKSVFDSVSTATGLDIAAIIQGQAVGRGIGESLSNTAPATSTETKPTRTAAAPPPPASAE